jgi:hypothetical protein
MMSQPPQWPDRPAQPPGGGSPPSRSRLALAAVAIVAGVLIVALLGMLVLILSSNARGATPGGEAQNGSAAAAGTGQPTAISGEATSLPGSADESTPAPTPTNTPPGASATPTPTPLIICCLTILPSVHQVVHQTTLSGTSVGPVVATCPAGELALSGGWAIGHSSGAIIYNSTRSGAGGWAVYVSHSSSVLVNSYVECLRNASGATVTQRLTQVSVAAGSTNGALAGCNAGEVLVGGGFALSPGLELYGFYANSATQWIGYAKNHSAGSTLFNTYAQCLTYGGAHSSQTTYRQSSVTAGATGSTASDACPSGTAVSGGGFADSIDAFVYNTSAGGDGKTWAAYLYANGGRDELLNSYAMCLGF